MEGTMYFRSSRFHTWILVGIALLSQAALAQRGGGSNGSNNPPSRGTTSLPPANNGTTNGSIQQPMFVFGKVLLEGGGTLPEPVAIERACNGVIRREGYSDSKGQFSFQVSLNNTLNNTFQDASEGGALVGPATANGSAPTLSSMTSCEFRAVLAGYRSSIATLRPDGQTWQFDIGTIFLKRLGDAKGTTISVTSMAAPKDAMRAYEKAQKLMETKPEEAEKNLDKAVHIYPQFATAWSLLGDIHRERNQFDAAQAEYTRAIAADPQFVNPLYGMALITVRQKKWNEAIQFTDQLIKLNAFAYPLAYFYNAAANYNVQKFDPAEENAKKFKALDTQHGHPEVSLLLANLLSRKKDYAGAAQQIRDYLAAAPNSPEAESLKTEAKRFEDLSVSSNAR
jgi:Tfp pilus assembly protein PilF